MSKPTLFFSHSSKDKDMVLAIKNKVMQYTSGTLEIFQSSDGESIPFGTNWIHKVEEGLKEAKVMFVFITEQSISSGWIYFEAGYAYSKGVHVIPVGIGVSVGDLKAPLNLLQGFNITSADSLNNFLTIINREFSYSFSAQFTDDDYNEIIALSSSATKHSTQFDEIVRSVKYELSGVYYENPGEKKTRNTKELFDRLMAYLDEHRIAYSLSKLHGYGYDKGSSLAVRGIKLRR
ncbi:MAG: toll/interleukin-1 receptor domain-containing protein [Faecousia sp.]